LGTVQFGQLLKKLPESEKNADRCNQAAPRSEQQPDDRWRTVWGDPCATVSGGLHHNASRTSPMSHCV
jgi:hypothetical protein